MTLIVQKFGGTSVADGQMISAAARKAIRAQREGNQVVMVVSAMGKNTDMLVDLAQQVNPRPPAREMDMLLSTGEQVSVALMAMAVHALGYKAVSLTGSQIGIITDNSHTKVRIRSISTDAFDNYWMKATSSSLRGSKALTKIVTSPPWAVAAAIRLPWPWPPSCMQTNAKSIPTSMACTPRIHACSRRRVGLSRLAMTKCWNWRVLAQE